MEPMKLKWFMPDTNVDDNYYYSTILSAAFQAIYKGIDYYFSMIVDLKR